MINSMTGFERVTCEREGRELTMELKSVNHRYLDLAFRLPRSIAYVEDTVRAILSEQLSRGHVDIYLSYRNTRKDAKKVEIDSGLLNAYLLAANAANEQLGLVNDITLSVALRLPDVTTITDADDDPEAVNELARECTQKALTGLKAMRAKEGARLAHDLLKRVESLVAITEQIAQRAPLVPADYQSKLMERIETLANGIEVDQMRLATEVAIFADRANIDEELVRLNSHFAQIKDAIHSDEPTGRKLDFIVQELNREFNTIGSKANDITITNLVIAAKGEVEKIREQVQNIE